MFIGHVRQDDRGEWHIHSLEEHLIGTAQLCRQFSEAFGLGNLGYMIGLLHDLGKYKTAFQQRIKGKSGYDPEAHVSRVDHATAGGLWAIKYFLDKRIGKLAAIPIITHHTGLQNLQEMEYRLSDQGEEAQALAEVEKVIDPSIVDRFKQTEIDPENIKRFGSNTALLIRMLFSALVDADSLDTEAFMMPSKSALRLSSKHESADAPSQISHLHTQLTAYIERMEDAAQDTLVNRLRREIRKEALSKAALEPGFFSLTVPTGGGKTLTSLAFALKHAHLHGKRRIIYSIPFTSIIDQTADVFRRALGDAGDEAILEHHSSVEAEKENARSLLLAENWEAPIIVTTNVQFYESLFASKRSRARKIHNIVNSVVILDECQTIPPDFINPILATLKELVRNYGVTVVFCSATPIAFQPVKSANHSYEGVENVREIISNRQTLFAQLKRFDLHLPYDWSTPTPLNELGAALNKEHQVLAIVNRKADARELFAYIDGPKVHLSTFMCPAHRRIRLAEVRSLLKSGAPIRVVSTQLIEAGVDIDFPVVYRALTGLDSIMQAGGRCNREGLMKEPGRVHVFVPPKPSPPGYLRVTEEIGRIVLQDSGGEMGPQQIEDYFDRLFWRRGGHDGGLLDKHQIQRKSDALLFEDVGKMRIIDEDTVPVLMPFDRGKELRKELKRLQTNQLERGFVRQLQPYSVSLNRAIFHRFSEDGVIETLHGAFHVLTDDDLYSDDTGLSVDDPTEHDPASLIV
jgi:CRISPR-associated endonuclease/helicase Cas3